MIFSRNTFAFLMGTLLLVSCSRMETRPTGAHLTTAQAIQIAQRAVQNTGHRLSDYNQPKAHYEFKDKGWFVLFDGKVPMVGNHLSVSIDDTTGQAEVIPGL